MTLRQSIRMVSVLYAIAVLLCRHTTVDFFFVQKIFVFVSTIDNQESATSVFVLFAYESNLMMYLDFPTRLTNFKYI